MLRRSARRDNTLQAADLRSPRWVHGIRDDVSVKDQTLANNGAVDTPRAIVCGIDGSEPSVRATEVAAELAHRLGATLHLIHVWSQPRSGFSEGNARRLVTDAVADARAAGADAKGHLETSTDAAASLIAHADHEHAMLIVVGTHGRTAVGRFVWGSAAHGVLKTATVPMLVVRTATAWPPSHVVVGDDGTEAAENAGGLAAKLAAAYAIDMTIVEALPSAKRRVAQGEETAVAQLVSQAGRHVRARAAELATSGQRPRVSVRMAPAPEALLGAARKGGQSCLVAVGRRDHAGDLLPDSTSQVLLERVTGPLLIYPTAR